MINAAKKAYHLLMRILAFISHCDLSSGCQFQQNSDHLEHILSLCRHFLASAHDKEASND